LPFDDLDFIFEIKWDGFRALAIIEHGRAQLILIVGFIQPLNATGNSSEWRLPAQSSE
jgi:hypothetical protein